MSIKLLYVLAVLALLNNAKVMTKLSNAECVAYEDPNPECTCPEDSTSNDGYDHDICEAEKACVKIAADDSGNKGAACGAITKYCNELTSAELLLADAETCDCYDFGDPRDFAAADTEPAGECAGDSAECNTATATQLENIPIELCDCLTVGDKRTECTSTISCASASPSQLVGVLVGTCGCIGDNDLREACICTAHGAPTNCKCAEAAPAPSSNANDYDHDTCLADKACDTISVDTSIVTCPCPTDPAALAQDPRYGTTCVEPPAGACATITVDTSIVTCPCPTDPAALAQDPRYATTCAPSTPAACATITVDTSIVTCPCPTDATELAADPRYATTCAPSTPGACDTITADTPIATCVCPLEKTAHEADLRKDGLCKCPVKKDDKAKYEADPRTAKGKACAAGSVRAAFAMVIAVLIVPALF